MEIKITNTGGVWRAVAALPANYRDFVGVMGARLDTPPWMEGVGPSPDSALGHLYEAIGRMVVQGPALPSKEAS